MASFIGKLFGADSPKVSAAPAEDVKKEQRKATTGRAALYQTQGGVVGEELNPEQVKDRKTLFGN